MLLAGNTQENGDSNIFPTDDVSKMKRTARNRRRRPPAELMPTSEIAELTTASFLQENNMNGDEGLFDSNGNDRRHQSANGHGAKTSTRPKSKQSCFELLEIHQIPVHLRFNKYVHTHYRPSMTIGGCLKSLFYLHNETVNVLTHGIPFFAILAAIPWYLPWDEITVPYLPTFHVVSSVSPWIGSTLYHLFMNHNTGYIAYKVLLTVDLLGIWITQTAGGLVTICATIHCLEAETKRNLLILYGLLCIYCLYKVVNAKCVWGRRFSFTAPFLVRMSMVALRGFNLGGGHPEAFVEAILMDVIAVAGAFIGGTNIPERWFPGKLDLICNSHHVMHVMVVYAVYRMHLGATLDLKWMTGIDAGAIQCTNDQQELGLYLDSASAYVSDWLNLDHYHFGSSNS